MANPQHNTYISIPPPPLPEFYMPKKTGGDEASASSGTDDFETITTSKASKMAYEHVSQRRRYPAMPGDGTDERYDYVKKKAGTDLSSSLAVYHVCRICLRPRSARYHREHPIPVDGMPPPPGICRRCRVTSVADSVSMADVVEHHESHGPKLGVKCLVTDDDYLRVDNMRSDKSKSRRTKYELDEFEWSELEPPPAQQSPPQQKEYIYRHIHVAVPPPPIHPPPQAAPPPAIPPPEPIYTYVPRPTAKSTAQDAIDSMSAKSSHSAKKTEYEIRRVEKRAPMPSSSPPVRSDIRVVESKKAVASSTKAKTEMEVRSSSGRGGSTSPEWTESQIRRLARDEVERYRQAERKMEAHGDAYAHGRMVPVERVPVVPVERRIEAQQDVADAMPWKAKPDKDLTEASYATRERRYRIRSESRDGKEEVLIVRKSGREPHVNETSSSRSKASPPSETSSDKTRWPSREVRQANVSYCEQPSRPTRPSRSARMDADELERTQVSLEKRRETAGTQKKDGQTAGHWVDFGPPPQHLEVRERKMQVLESEADYARSTMRAHRRDHGRVASEYDRRDSGVAGMAISGQKQSVQQVTQEVQLPYPRDEMAIPVPMPSPSSHASRPAKHAPSRNNDSEYYYKLRTVQPVDEVTYRRNDDPGEYYKETSEYLHRRKTPPEPKQPEQSSTILRKAGDRRQSDASSRVRFSNKVAVSPTPPASDASSARFHTQKRADTGGADKVVDYEYERRGRAPSRIPASKPDYFYAQDAYPSQQRHRGRVEEGTGRPAARGRRTSGETETATAASTLPIDVRMLARAQSESPSREKLFADARRRRQDGFGPYTAQYDRSASVEAYDGSSLGSAGDDGEVRRKERREYRERREHSRQRSKR